MTSYIDPKKQVQSFLYSHCGYLHCGHPCWFVKKLCWSDVKSMLIFVLLISTFLLMRQCWCVFFTDLQILIQIVYFGYSKIAYRCHMSILRFLNNKLFGSFLHMLEKINVFLHWKERVEWKKQNNPMFPKWNLNLTACEYPWNSVNFDISHITFE